MTAQWVMLTMRIKLWKLFKISVSLALFRPQKSRKICSALQISGILYRIWNYKNNYHFRFSFKSFSFNAEGNGSQKLSCNINFCLIGKNQKLIFFSQRVQISIQKLSKIFLDENECATATDSTKLVCNNGTPYQWAKP